MRNFGRILLCHFYSFLINNSCEIGSSPLVLDGHDVKLVSICVNGKEVKVCNFPTFPKVLQYKQIESLSCCPNFIIICVVV